jgi:hypothetical protein
LAINNCMGDTKVSDLPAITLPVASNDILYIGDVSAGTSNKITYTNLTAPIDATVSDITLTVDSLSADVLSLSATVDSVNIDIGPLVTDLLVLSGQVQTLSTYQDEIIYTDMAWLCASIDDLAEETADVIRLGHTGNVIIGGTTLTFLSGILITVT